MRHGLDSKYPEFKTVVAPWWISDLEPAGQGVPRASCNSWRIMPSNSATEIRGDVSKRKGGGAASRRLGISSSRWVRSYGRACWRQRRVIQEW
jgi:hypothetical protein